MNFIHSKFLNTVLIFVKESHQVKFLFLHIIFWFSQNYYFLEERIQRAT